MYLNFSGFKAECVLDSNKTFEDFAANPDMWFAQEYNGQRHKYSMAEIQGQWNCVLKERERITQLNSLLAHELSIPQPSIEFDDSDFANTSF